MPLAPGAFSGTTRGGGGGGGIGLGPAAGAAESGGGRISVGGAGLANAGSCTVGASRSSSARRVGPVCRAGEGSAWLARTASDGPYDALGSESEIPNEAASARTNSLHVA